MKLSKHQAQFAMDVSKGLDADNKHLSSRYFYDARGDSLFQKIMVSPEYYLTDCELEIFERQGAEIAEDLGASGQFELVELGSGDGLKTSLLLDALHKIGANFVYRPLDISANSLKLLSRRLSKGRDWLKMKPIHADYTRELAEARLSEEQRQCLKLSVPRKVFMFLGSNLGNYPGQEAVTFLRLVRYAMRVQDALLIGLDLAKDPEVVNAAYNDAAGLTRDFNLNLLERINRELGGNFDPGLFEHVPEYDPVSGMALSFLRSNCRQRVDIAATGQQVVFRSGEKIFVEISQKYNSQLMADLARAAEFSVGREFYDSQRYFTDQIWYPK